MDAQLLERVRYESALSHSERAALGGTSRTTLSAYEHRRKSPTLATVERLLDSVGYDLSFEARVQFSEHPMRRGRPIFVPDRLWRLQILDAFTTVHLPIELNWSKPGATFALTNRRQRARCYEIVLREGMPADILKYIDGAFLVDLWSELVIPREIRAAWQPVIDAAVP